MEHLKISVSNVKCGGCVSVIEAALMKVAGVESTTVEVATGTVAVSCHDVPRASLIKRLEEIGFPESQHEK